MGVDTFSPIEGRLQIGDGVRDYLIDPLTIDNWQPLAALLENPAVVKVVHACSEDLEVLLRLTGSLPAPLFDTQLAAAYLNLGACAALAWALSRRSLIHRAVPFAIYLLLVGTEIVVASRGGVLATLFGTALVLWLARRRAPERPAVPWYALAGGGVAVVLVGAFVLGLRELSVSELTSDDTVKLSIIRQSLATLSTFRIQPLTAATFGYVLFSSGATRPVVRSSRVPSTRRTTPSWMPIACCRAALTCTAPGGSARAAAPSPIAAPRDTGPTSAREPPWCELLPADPARCPSAASLAR